MKSLADKSPDRSSPRVDHNGTVYVPGSCSSCKGCWIIRDGTRAGKCMYGGPFVYVEVK
jgi:hypothetical protein